MALEDQVISLAFGQGVDTKTDSKALLPGKLALLENGIFTNPKRVSKRNGYDDMSLNIVGGGTISSIKAAKEYNGELTLAADGRIYSYSSNSSRWSDKGAYVSVEATTGIVSSSAYNQCEPVSAYYNGYSLYAWFDSNGCYACVRDESTGTKVLNDTLLAAKGSGSNLCRAVLLAGNQLAVFYINAADSLAARLITFGATGPTIGAEATCAANLSLQGLFDVVGSATGGYLVYSSAASPYGAQTGIVTAKLSSSGAVTASDTISVGGGKTSTCVCVVINQASSYVFSYYSLSTGVATFYDLYGSVYTSNIASVTLSTRVVANLKNLSSIAAYDVLPGAYSLAGTCAQKVIYCHESSSLPRISWTVLNDIGGIYGAGPWYLIAGCSLAGKVFTVNSRYYLPVIYYSLSMTSPYVPVQNGLFILDLSSQGVAPDGIMCQAVAKALYGRIGMLNGYVTQRLVVPEVMMISSTKAVCPSAVFEGWQPILGGKLAPATEAQSAAGFAQFDFASTDAYQALNVGGVTIWNGSIPTMYDGRSTSELGFLLYPEFTSATVGAGGSLADGTYQYFAVYQWYDNQGNLHQSAPSPALSVTVSGKGGAGSVAITVTSLKLTAKNISSLTDLNKPQVVIYRTQANGTIATSCMVTAVLVSESAAQTLSYTDAVADSLIVGAQQLYTTGGVVENIPPPPCMTMASHNNRLWLVDSESGSVWYSKTITSGFGISTSDLMTAEIDGKLGKILALASLDEKLVLQKQKGFAYLAGDGVTDTGIGSTLTPTVFVPSDVGADYGRSFIVMPTGIIVKTAKGFYLLDRSLNASYIGAEVEAYNSQTITDCTILKDRSQVRFLTSSGSSLVYDYVMGQWSVFTNHTGLSATIWGSSYIYVTTANKLYKENASSFLDGTTAYALKAKTAPIKMAGIQGFQRIRRIGMLGDYSNGSSGNHKIQASFAFDYSTSFSTPLAYAPGASGSAGVFQYRERLPLQKCEALQILIEESTTSASGEYVGFTDLSLEVAIKRGTMKLGNSKTVR